MGPLRARWRTQARNEELDIIDDAFRPEEDEIIKRKESTPHLFKSLN